MFLPNAQFWRIWGIAAVLVAAFAALCLNARISHAETARASFYGAESGRRTASGARFNPLGFTVAHRSLRFGTRLRFCLVGCQIGVVTDRGPAAWTGRSYDLSRGLARSIGLDRRGVALIHVERLN